MSYSISSYAVQSPMNETVLQPRADKTPQYWTLLNNADQAGYLQLQQEFSLATHKNIKGKASSFDRVLSTIKVFAERHEEDDWKRFLVCGICWLDDSIAINTRQLRQLICKCKSSINGSLQKLGYVTDVSHSEAWNNLFPHIPLLKDRFVELRQWTIRYKKGTRVRPTPTSTAPPVITRHVPATKAVSGPVVWPLKFRQKVERLSLVAYV